MKKIIVGLLSVILTLGAAQAQPGEDIQEKVQALKVAVFTEELDLTPAEAQKFWPLYNEFDEKMRKLGREMRAAGKPDWSGKSDKEIEQMIEKRFALQEKKLALEREYYKKFKKILPIQKVAKMPHAERKVKKIMVEKMRGPRPRNGRRGE